MSQSISEEWGAFDFPTAGFGDWVCDGLGAGWRLRQQAFTIDEARRVVARSTVLTAYLLVPFGGWTAMLSNGPRGTDVGLFPSYAARELHCRALRVVCTPANATFPARILEVFGPDGTPPLLARRSVAVSKDGSRWVFEQSGRPFPFEDASLFTLSQVGDRFTEGTLSGSLRELGVPEVDFDWGSSWIVERDND